MYSRMKGKAYKLLRKSERYTKTDMVYLTKGGGWLMTGQIISLVSALTLSVLFANLLPQETFGEYKFILSTVGIISIITLPGINTALTRATAQSFYGAIRIATKIRFKWSLAASAICIGTSLYYYLNQNNEFFVALIIAAFFIPFFESFNTYKAVLDGKKDFKTRTLFEIISQTVSFATLAVTLIFTDKLHLLLVAYFLPWATTRIYFFIKSSRKINLPSNSEAEAEMISYGKNLTLMNSLVMISSHLDKIILFHFLGAVQVAIYSFAVAIPEQLKSLIMKISILAFPKFSTKSKEEIQGTIWVKLLILGAGLLALSIIYIALAPFIFSFLFPLYSESILLSQIFAISIVTLILYIPLDILKALKRTKDLYYFNISTSLIRITLAIILIYFYGLYGAIISWTLARFFNLAYLLILLKKTLR